MKKVLLMAVALMMLPFMSMAVDYKEGVHYTVVNQGPATAKPEVSEYFSFYCPHCYNFARTVVPKLEQQLPSGVVFKQKHVEFIGRAMGVEMSRAFAIAHQLKVDKKIEMAMFNAIHDRKQKFNSREDIRKLFIANGVDGKDFDTAANSFMVNAMMSSMKRDTQNAQLSGVPALVVNGKYRIETSAIKTYDELVDLAVYLTQVK